MDFHQINGHNSIAPNSMCHFSFSVPRRLADKRSDSQSTPISDKVLPSSCTRSRLNSKSKEVRISTSSEFHVHRHGISDTTRISQGPSSLGPNFDYQISSFPQSSIGMNFTFSFEQLIAAADFVLLGKLYLQPLQMCLLSVWRPHILPLDHQITINSMIRFHLKWWLDTNRITR